ncbi:MAG: hypothetical protein IT348_00425 [Candidatus Eisenbacteria bacterium]|nr:hypothetical protein [Candidatus Eisenbacteria bacterium]
MRRARSLCRLVMSAACLVLPLLLVLSGCGRKEDKPQDLTFETLADTSGLAQGKPLLTDFEAIRHDNGLLRVRGKVAFPDGTRIQIAVKKIGELVSVAMVQVTVQGGEFDSPPMMGEAGPLPVDTWRFEITAQFTPEFQPGEVMLATNNGLALRGPGITRTRLGGATFFLAQELKR